ncbi:MAG: 3-hydroxyacyl-CoA dehydrogenase NAD-binding domain-containing protein [Acidobacteriota bacterium]
MNGPICSKIHDGVAVITINHPPVNALTTGVPQGIVEALNAVRDDVTVRSVVIHGAGRNFAAGADIKEFVRFVAGHGPMPELNRWFNAIEDFPKPVIMAIHGAALGAGLELAMAGHYRIATADAQLGQPEVKIGLIPGAGGTQRLPRLVGVKQAAEMCALGEPITAADALASGLIDRVVAQRGAGPQSGAEAPASAVSTLDELLEAAIQFARETREIRRTKDCHSKLGSPADAEPILSEIRARCAKSKRGLEAPRAALDAIAAAISTDLEAGLKLEAEIFHRLMSSDQCKALIHAFFAERTVSKVPGLAPDTHVLPIHQVAVVGAGTMGAGIAMALANAGIPVRLRDSDADALQRGMKAIQANYARSIQSGSLTDAQRDQRLSLISPQTDWVGFDQADLVIEAVFESMTIKRDVFAEVDRIAKPSCILASNTSTLNIDRIAAATSRPTMVVGLHFFSPANVMRLLEIVRGRETAPEVLATAMAFAKNIKKVGVVVGNGLGFVGNRMIIPYMDEAQFLVEEGATPEQVDRVLTGFGMAMGPFAVADLSGLDVFWHIHEGRFSATSTAREPLGLELLYRQGRYGQKTQAGWFKYGSDRKPKPDTEVVEQVQAAATQQGISQREISDAEILDRCLLALINEGAKLLEEGIASRAVDIDVIYMTGYGFPSHRGGPMFFADTVGLKKILKRIRELQKEQADVRWKPAGLLETLVAEGKRFGELA